MADIDLTPTVEYYRGKLREHGPGPRGMDWKDEDSQNLRFDVISRYIDFSRCPSVIDVGCGSGEFLNYCHRHNQTLDYLGIDVCPEMIDAFHARFPDESARLETVEQCASTGQSFDYAIASGTFNAKLDVDEHRWREYFHASIDAMFRLCRVAAIVNMMTSFVDYRYDRLYYPTPDEVCSLTVGRLSRNFTLDHSYPLYEMTLVIFR
ncbi:MAG: methyltransferase domain-containing protein [Phycisphaera sp.]|nr:methyltransferase domain-containing protein [Phycisphaera sp.]